MFGCIVAGKPVLSDPIPVSETQGLITIPYPPNEVRHVVLFLTSPLPNPGVELGAAVHLGYSAEGSTEMQWVYLGHVDNNKPSAIFKVVLPTAAENSHQPQNGVGLFGQFSSQRQPTHTAHLQIGVSVEPLSEISQKTASDTYSISTLDSFSQFCRATLDNLQNYVMSFAVTQSQMTPDNNAAFIPMSSFANWVSNFERKLQHNPNFWKK